MPPPPPPPGLDAYTPPPPNTPASPSWFGPPSPGRVPPAPVPRPVRVPSAKRARPRDPFAEMPQPSPAPQPTGVPTPAPVGAFSGFDPTAAYAGAGSTYGGLTGDRQGPAERTGMAHGGGTGAGMAAYARGGGTAGPPDEWIYQVGKGSSVTTPSKRPAGDAHTPGLMDWIARRLGWA